jgi:hypothetical protein
LVRYFEEREERRKGATLLEISFTARRWGEGYRHRYLEEERRVEERVG